MENFNSRKLENEKFYAQNVKCENKLDCANPSVLLDIVEKLKEAEGSGP